VQHAGDESGTFGTEPTWAAFVDALEEELDPVGNYHDQYTGWTTLRQERDQTVPEYTNIFHTLRSKLGIRDAALGSKIPKWSPSKGTYKQRWSY
jgi:hypothetical protein